MRFEIKKNLQNPRQIAVRASVFSLRAISFTNSSMDFGLPFGWKVQAQALSGKLLKPAADGPSPSSSRSQLQRTEPLAQFRSQT
jgi:hypothetical protein